MGDNMRFSRADYKDAVLSAFLFSTLTIMVGAISLLQDIPFPLNWVIMFGLYLVVFLIGLIVSMYLSRRFVKAQDGRR